MKKLLSVLAATSLIALGACGSDDESPAAEAGSDDATATAPAETGGEATAEPSAPAGEGGLIGIAMPTKSSSRWISDGNSMVESFEALGYETDLQYAEDDEWSRRLKDHGWGVAFADRSIAIHSHNYTLRQAYKRCHGDSFAAAATQPERRPKWSNWIYGVALPWLSDLRRDWAWCARAGRRREFGHCALVRLWQRCGKTVGFRRGWRHYHQRSAA